MSNGDPNFDENAGFDVDDVTVLRALVAGTASGTGEAFLQSLVRHLAIALNVQYAFIAEFAGVETRVRTRAYWARDRIVENIEYELAGTPCEDVINGRLCHHPQCVADLFPDDLPLREMEIESYLGVPLVNDAGSVLGHLAVFDVRPMPPEPKRLQVFRIFAARAAAELDRLRMERELAHSEQRYRDLFEQAPIPYVYEDTDTRFINANAAFMKLLGLKPEDVPGTFGLSLVSPDPAVRARLDLAFADIKAGRQRELIELELRRKDNGHPVWVQFWSRPDPDGKHTRTMVIDITDRVLAEREGARLQQQNLYLQEEIKQVHNFEEIIGRSGPLKCVLENVERVAQTDATVLITGETGTGKELIARAIHSLSKRKDKPLIKINCAALPSGLVESELFGHEKGAFTGAITRRIGRFELAAGGTIFLDEIGEISPEAQAKLLRVLQEREFERVGGTATIKADVRVLAATNRDLLSAVRDKTFRDDLYYRLSVFPIHLPALRERRDDIPLLTHFLVDKFKMRIGKPIDGVATQTMERLMNYAWPGNIRELENVLERAVILANGRILEIDPLMLPLAQNGDTAATALAPVSDLESVERGHILLALEQTGWVIDGERGAAKILGLHANTLRSRMKKLAILRAESKRS